MQKVKKVKVPKLIFEPTESEWQTLQDPRQVDVAKALANPVRRSILDELGPGAIRQFELAKRISKSTGKKYPASLLRHHLQQLERAELVGYEVDLDMSKRVKMVYRTADVRVQLRPRPKPMIELEGRRAPKTREEFSEELKRMLKK